MIYLAASAGVMEPVDLTDCWMPTSQAWGVKRGTPPKKPSIHSPFLTVKLDENGENPLKFCTWVISKILMAWLSMGFGNMGWVAQRLAVLNILGGLSHFIKWSWWS